MRDLWIPVCVALAMAGVAGLPWLYRRYEAEKERRAAPSYEKRFRELCALARAPEFELKVSGSSQLLYGVLVVLTGACLIFLVAAGEAGVWAGLGGGFSLALGLIGLAVALPTLGKAKISITRFGFKTPTTPFIPWKLVQGIHLQEIVVSQRTFRETRLGHYLEFFIPSLPLVMSRSSLFMRLANRTVEKTRLRVVLRNASEPPEVLYRFIQHLCTASTGATHVWFPGMSDAFNEAMRRMDEAEARFIKEALAGPNARKASGGEDIAKTFSEAADTVEAEMGRSGRKERWWLVAITVAMMAWIAVQYLRV